MDEVMLGADRVAEAGGSPSEQLAMLGDELLDVIHRYPDHVWVFLHEFPALTAERAEQFRERRREYERRVEAVLQAGIDAGEFRDVDPWLTARAWLGMHNYTYLWLKAGGRVSAATSRSRSPTSSSAGSRNSAASSTEASGRHRRVEAEEPAERAADHARPARRRADRRQLLASAPGCRGTCLRRAGSRCPTRCVDTPVMCRHATATGSSWNDTWNWRCTYSLGIERVGPLVVQAEELRHARLVVVGAGVVPDPSHQSASWPMPVTQHLSIAPTSDASQCALNSISAKCRSG